MSDTQNTDFARWFGPKLLEREKTRTEALRCAVQADNGLPHPTVPSLPGCKHNRQEDCDCPAPDPQVRDDMVRIMEEETIDRILRNADRFYNWITADITPEKIRDMHLLDGWDDGGGEAT